MSEFEKSLRPHSFEDFIGQKHIINNLKIYIQAAMMRDEVLDHCLFHGPAGLGKTSLAQIMANELKVDLTALSALGISHSGDLIAVVSDLKRGEILFIDEIHRLSKSLQETLYTIMEDFSIDIVVGSEESARSIHLKLEPFTLIGATTLVSNLTPAFKDRFGIQAKFEYYDAQDIQSIIMRSSEIMMCNIDTNAIIEITKRSRGTPRIANRYLKRVWDFATVYQNQSIDSELALHALDQLNIDESGLSDTDLQYLQVLIGRFKGGPVGVQALASILSEEVSTLESVYEPYLLQIGMIDRTSRGRIATQSAYHHLGIIKDFDKEI